MEITGVDHADIRVPLLEAVEPFYDAFLPLVGLSRKSFSHVGSDGEWYDVDAAHPRNTVEYHTQNLPGTLGWFIGFIEDPLMIPTQTRIAFALDGEANLPAIEALVRKAGARAVEWSIDPGYPALFFEDPCGTRLEICARRVRA